jgi:hyperosmotically inducible protein
MSRTQARWAALAAAALAIAWAGPGQSQETGKKVGERLDEVGREIKGGLNRAGSAAKDQFARARTSVHAMGVESRIYGRIHWDKALNDALIELAATGDGVVTLDGTVADARAKRRAVELAQETVGVTQVVDRLAVRPAATTGP